MRQIEPLLIFYPTFIWCSSSFHMLKPTNKVSYFALHTFANRLTLSQAPLCRILANAVAPQGPTLFQGQLIGQFRSYEDLLLESASFPTKYGSRGDGIFACPI